MVVIWSDFGVIWPNYQRRVLQLLPRFQEDLPDLTPRRFLRHPITKSYLTGKFPGLLNPTLSDLHISLANRSHLKTFIDQVRKGLFPCGTGWKGKLTSFILLFTSL
ncbi:hypothetical protein FB451DRAFT_1282292 [Mycena latifolia]|nr:hypothetical protein FB451DRAFT_1282292 [Mycena latifolia]